MRKLTEDNEEQQENIKTLQRLNELRYSRLETSLNIFETLSANTLHNSLIEGKKVMDSIRLVVTKMEDVESNLLKQREKIKEENISITPLSVLFLVVLSLLILLFYFARITRQLNITQEFADQVNQKNIIWIVKTNNWKNQTRN
ncbi:MAG: hypothetical protein C4329_04895 [Chitinophagaceae bacterium]